MYDLQNEGQAGLPMALRAIQSTVSACVLGAILALIGTGCANAPRPVSGSDREQIARVNLQAYMWRLDASLVQRPARVLAVLFDGTRNDIDNLRPGERGTIIAEIKRALDRGGKIVGKAEYCSGVGTDRSRAVAAADAAFGLTIASRAESAFSKVKASITSIQAVEPDADIRIVVAGFSRGAASARHFMNLVSDHVSSDLSASTNVHQYAILFDTVSASLLPNLRLAIPENADLVIHFISRDERRLFFRPIIDLDPHPALGRISTLSLPGVHSDTASAYAEGVGLEYVDMVQSILFDAGLTDKGRPGRQSDPTLQGMHDSRWLVDRVLGIRPANTINDQGRRPTVIESATLSPTRFAEWKRRQEALVQTTPMQISSRVENPRPEFEVSVSPSGFLLRPRHAEYRSARLIRDGDSACLESTMVNDVTFNVSVPPGIVRQLEVPTPKGHRRLSWDFVVPSHRAWWAVDGIERATAAALKRGACEMLQ